MIPQPPQITPEPLWRRAYLQAGTLVMAVVTQAGLIIRDLKTAVCCRHRMVNRRGLPTRHHLDADLQQLPRSLEGAVGDQLAADDRQWLADLDAAITSALPTDLAPFLTRPLSPLAARLLAALAAPRRQS